MTIRERINEAEACNAREHLERLLKLGAPDVVVEASRQVVASAEAGQLTVKGDQALLDLAFTSFEVCKGNGGKLFVRFETSEGSVNYFPRARYGRFISKAK